MNRALLKREYVAGTLLGYWDMDTEPMALTNSTSMLVIDRLNRCNGTISLFCLVCSTRAPTVSLGPSDAPIVSYAGSWNYLITKSEDTFLGPLSFICLENDSLNPISCDTTNLSLDALTVTSQSSSGLTKPAYGAYSTNMTFITYQPFTFLLTANRGLDSFSWALTSQSQSSTIAGGAFIKLYAPPAENMYSPYNVTAQLIQNGVTRPTFRIPVGSRASIVSLPCYSNIGAKPVPFILSAPSSSKLYQIDTTLASNGTFTMTQSKNQVLSCGSYTSSYPYISDLCYIQSDSQSVYYVPMADPLLGVPSDLYINYSCGLPAQDLMMTPMVMNITTQPLLDRQLSFDSSLVGPNPFALQFDGVYTHVAASIEKSLDVAAVSIWVRPDLNAVYDTNSTTYSESHTVLQLFPTGVKHQMEILLMRNASSYPNYFVVVNNYNTQDTSIGTNTIYTLSTYALNSTAATWVQPAQWTNILVTQSPSAASTSLVYLDGSPVSSGTFGAISPPSSIHLGTAAQYDPPANHNKSFSGLLDDFSLWSSSFTPYEALSLQLQSIATSATGLIAYWDFDEGVGFVAEDSMNNYTFVPQIEASDTNATALSQAQAMPCWAWPFDLSFSSVSTSISTPQLLTLSAYAGAPSDSWKLAVYITNLPDKGTLYQVPANLTIVDTSGFSLEASAFSSFKKNGQVENDFLFAESLINSRATLAVNMSDPLFIASLTPITSAFSSVSDVAVYHQWASTVFSVSSSRAAPTGSISWNASNIVGAPSWWKSPSSNNTTSSPSSKRFQESDGQGGGNGQEKFDDDDEHKFDEEEKERLFKQEESDPRYDEEEWQREDPEEHGNFDQWFRSQSKRELSSGREQAQKWFPGGKPDRQQQFDPKRPGQHNKDPHHRQQGFPRQPFPMAQPSTANPQHTPISETRFTPINIRADSPSSDTSTSTSTDSDLVSQNSPVYGENPLSWSPASECSGVGSDLEFIEVGFPEAMYIRRVEIFQNLLSGAVTRVAVWDSGAELWRNLYVGTASYPLTSYTTFTPSISAFVSFQSNRIRVELDTCTYLGWYEIEAIRISGTKMLPDGVVSDPQARVIFVPNTSFATTDSMTYSASTNPLSLSTASPSFSYDLEIGHVTAAPVVYTQTVNVQAREFTLIQLQATNSDSASIQRIISKLPSIGSLLNAAKSNDGSYYPTNQVGSSSTDVIVSNADGFVFFHAPDACKYNFASFQYYATSNGQTSSTATITMNSLCQPSFLNYARWLAVILLVVVILAIIVAGLFGLYAIAERKQRAVENDRHPILVAIAMAACLSYASLFFEFAPATVGFCIGKLWVLHIGTTLLVASALALILVRWTDFSSQTLRSANRETASIPISALILGGVALAIEIVQLIIFTAINRPEIKIITSQDNSAASVAICNAPRFPYTLLVINKAVWLIAMFVIACILLSVSATNGRSNYSFLLFSSIVGIVSGLAFIISLYTTHSPAILLTLNVLALVIPISIFIGTIFLSHIVYRRTNKIQNVVETSEFGLQPIGSSQKNAPRGKNNPQLSNTAANVQMTIDMNNHSVDKSVASLLDTVQMKEREIAHLKRKLLKRHYKIRELQQKLTETNESSNMQLFGSLAPDYTE